MLKFSYVILLAIAVPLAAYGDTAPDMPATAAPAESAPVETAAPVESAPGESAPAAAPQGEKPRAVSPRPAPRGKVSRSEAPRADAAHGKAVARLRDFLVNTHTAQADFTQEVLDKNGKRTQRTSGVMHFSRPGKFRWSYLTPYEQIIVGDGEKFWLYDVDLNQVTVKKLDAALGSSPAALLAGSYEMERDFDLKDIECAPRAPAGQPASGVAGERAPACEDALEWLEARPKGPESSFERIRMAFNAKSDLVVMDLRDSFGHVTVLRFSNMQHNPRLPAVLFKFEPPKGADVVGDE
ncbi:MAG TPA: outer membrane lipoprotein chaperone LolA [Gallionellaceae bacterium]